MNFHRGLFRLWIVVSIFWVAIISGIAYFTFLAPRETAASQQACADARIADPKLGNPYACFDGPVSFDDLIPIGPAVTKYVSMAVLPPVALLGFGLIVMWVGRGFRAK
jgi:hypothetical protein